jgi:hypothetical protein
MMDNGANVCRKIAMIVFDKDSLEDLLETSSPSARLIIQALVIHTIKKHNNQRHKIPWKLLNYDNCKSLVERCFGVENVEKFSAEDEEEIESSDDEMPGTSSSGNSSASEDDHSEKDSEEEEIAAQQASKKKKISSQPSQKPGPVPPTTIISSDEEEAQPR